MSTPARTEKVFFPNLDGLRFICFFVVFLFHSFVSEVPAVLADERHQFLRGFLVRNGNLGVNCFFVLSGFLITYLLLVERRDFGKIDIGGFYMRRVLRIWPLYFVCVFIGFVLFPWAKHRLGMPAHETAHLGAYLTFTSNFDTIRHGLPDASTLNILWSIAVEEQFYLVWPVLLTILPIRWYLPVFSALVIAAYIFCYAHIDNIPIVYWHTVACMGDLCIGAISAVLIFRSASFKAAFENLHRGWIIALYLVTLVVCLFRQEIFWSIPALRAADRYIISVLFALIILEQNYSRRSLFKFASFRNLSKLGTYTYGLYCLHMIAILVAAVLLRRLGLNTNFWSLVLLEGGFSLLLSVAMALLSFRILERPFLKLKHHFARILTR